MTSEAAAASRKYDLPIFVVSGSIPKSSHTIHFVVSSFHEKKKDLDSTNRNHDVSSPTLVAVDDDDDDESTTLTIENACMEMKTQKDALRINNNNNNRNVVSSMEEEENDDDFEFFCQKHIAVMPQLPTRSIIGTSTDGDHRRMHRLLYHLEVPFHSVTSLRHDDGNNNDDDVGTDVYFQWSRIFFSNNNISDDDANVLLRKVPTPFHIHPSFLPFDDNHHDMNHDATLSWGAIPSSKLSGGGMHQSLSYQVRLLLPTPSSSLSAFGGQLTLIQPLQQGIYVDVDDPTPHPNFRCRLLLTHNDNNDNMNDHPAPSYTSSCNVTLMAPSRIIDIEQPSFSSPQNVIAYTIDIMNYYDHDDEKPSELVLEFITMLHVRYPKPIIIGGGQQKRVRNVTVSPPFVWNGQLQWKPQKDETYTAVVATSSSFNPFFFDLPNSKDYNTTTATTTAILTIPAAAGCQSDYIMVISTTFMFCVIGSIIMMKEIIRIGHWN